MTQDTSEKIALITGASRGLGAALAERLGAQGWHIIAVARTTGALEELDDRIKEAGGSATLAPLDVTNENAMRHLCRSVYDRWGRVDLWAHAAIHAAPMSPAGHMALKDLDKTIATNIRATGALIPMVEPLLRAAAAGTALFFDDATGGKRFFGTFGSSKAAQIAMARSWQHEAAKIGPRILIDTPAPMPTATRARFFPGEERAKLTPCATEAARIVASL
ncbi:SDR family NAD(P)-dependent oxidoreductase [Roseicitreum antarcticum]|nr:SDR family NAD(P)-dependent oxidoreductase [Roseicitreum antarcticum]